MATRLSRSTSTKEEFDESMYEIQKQVLEENRAYLCTKIQPERHYPYLRQQRVLSLDGQQLIQHEITTSAKVNKLIDELISNGGPQAFLMFTESLRRDGTQSHVLKRLNLALDEKRANPTFLEMITQADQQDERHPVEDDDDLISVPSESPEVDHRHSLPPPTLPSFDELTDLRPKPGPPPSANREPRKPELVAHGQPKSSTRSDAFAFWGVNHNPDVHREGAINTTNNS